MNVVPAQRGDWQIREPGTGQPLDEPSWSGVPIPASSTEFDAPEVTTAEDQWGDGGQSNADPARVQAAETSIQEGRFRDALLIYQELSFLHPEDAWLSRRVGEVAAMLSSST